MKRLSYSTFLIACILLFFASCSHEKRHANLNGIDLKINIKRFDKDFWALDTNNLKEGISILEKKYPNFTPIYFEKVVSFGNPKDSSTQAVIKLFQKDTTMAELYPYTLDKFKNISDIESQLTDAFRRAKYFFPKAQIPQFYMHWSGFNQNIVTGPGFISLSIDDYLGTNCRYYKKTNIYDYQLANMRRDKVAPDYVTAWLLTEFPFNKANTTLLEDIIYRGKIMYTLSVLMPTEKDWILMGYTRDQWKWANTNEKQMWSTLVNSKDLFTTQPIEKGQYLNDGPFTLPFTQDSPGRGGIYIGWQIIESYMKRQKNITPLELMRNDNANRILEQSGYRP